MFKRALKSAFRWSSREDGATLVEYGIALIVALIVGASAINVLGNKVAEEITETASAF